MIELVRHIEILLLENDCVVVPGLGGFIAHYQPAHYEEDEGLFLPPVRTVGFNPQLTMNDGLLVQAYMQTYHTDFPDATRKLSAKVCELKEILYNEGVLEMTGIGTLYYNIYNNYEFHPLLNGILSPVLYALDAFPMASLSMEITEGHAVSHEEPQVTVPSAKREFVPDSHWWGHAVAVAIAAILFFVLSVPVENTYIDKGHYASLGTAGLFDAIRSQSVAVTLPVEAISLPQKSKRMVAPVAVKVEKVAPGDKEVKETPKAEVKKEVKKTAATKPAVARKRYHIIVASLPALSDAERMLQEYKQQGYADASIKEGKGRFRISISGYTDKSAAYKKLDELRQTEAFKNAWMLTSK